MKLQNSISLSAAALLASLVFAVPAQAAPVTKQVTIQAIKVCNDVGNNCASAITYESYADKIWAQAGIDFVFLPTLTWNSSFANVYNYDNYNLDAGALLAQGTAAFAPAANVLNVYFVQNLSTSSGTLFGFGCGAPIFAGDCFNQTGVVINSSAVDSFNGGIGRLDTVAHEVGHVLGLTHNGLGAGDGVPDNLMTAGSFRSVPQSLGDINPDGAGLSKLTSLQIAEARSSSFAQDVPEPGSLALAGLALAGVMLSRRGGRVLAAA